MQSVYFFKMLENSTLFTYNKVSKMILKYYFLNKKNVLVYCFTKFIIIYFLYIVTQKGNNLYSKIENLFILKL